MSKPRLLDGFCKAGGAGMGYHRAGFEVVGVDIEPQPRYPFKFIQADFLSLDIDFIRSFDVIHASPPCNRYSTVANHARKNGKVYPDIVEPTRNILISSGKPYVMENVLQSPLKNAIMLCGSMFGLDVQRHRLFESNVLLFSLECQHSIWKPQYRSLYSRQKSLSKVIGNHGHLNYPGEFELRCKAMGIEWMNAHELTQAIPPAYTEFIGKQLMEYLRLK